MNVRMLWLLAVGCGGNKIEGTVVSSGPTRDCPTDRPIEESDLDCLCGAVTTYTLVDTVVPDDCDELWCHADELELECIWYGTTDSGTSSSSSSSSSGSGG